MISENEEEIFISRLKFHPRLIFEIKFQPFNVCGFWFDPNEICKFSRLRFTNKKIIANNERT